MQSVNTVSAGSYLHCNPHAIHETSEGRGWHGLTVNLDHFEPFQRDMLRYSEHHVCINVGKKAGRLTYVWEDGYRLRTLDKTIRPGEFLITPADHPVRWHLHDNATALSIRLHAEFVKHVAEARMGMNADQVKLLHRIPVRDRKVLSLGSILRDELRIGGPGDRLCAESTANLLAAHLLRNYSAQPPRGLKRREPPSTRVVREVLGNVKDNLTNPAFLSLASQARELNVSDSQLSRWFLQSEGMPFKKYIDAQRAELAKQLLLGFLEKSVEEIRNELGFTSQGHFCEFFKRMTGLTPTEFRKASR